MTGDGTPHRGNLRPLTSNERAVLDRFLVQNFDGVEALRLQARHVLASPGCTCGCGTINLHVPHDAPKSSSGSHLPIEGELLGADGEPIGGLLLFLDDGRLAGLEVHSFDDPLPLPLADQVRW